MAGRDVEWGFYDRHLEAASSRRFLPHLEMPGAVTFVTFRLADSMPRAVVVRWREEVDAWLAEHGFAGWSAKQVLESQDVDLQRKRELRRFKERCWHGHLDRCHGSCHLKAAEMREQVAASLLHFDGQRYDVERFVIMPNHVHVLLQMRADFSLRQQFRAIQRFSARRINHRLKRSGSLWQGEPFDHIVRNEAQFEYLRKYITDNPAKAGITEAESTIWITD